ncbi:hypothetical protein ACEPAF_5735 [Sanghuangporus sanghuang]
MSEFPCGRDQTRFSDGSNEESLRDAIFFKLLVPALRMCPKTDVAGPKSHTSAFSRRLTWSLLGRNSCGTRVCDRESEQIQWLKNCWRKDMKMNVVEHSSYKESEQHKVQNLIPLSVANDVHVRDKTYGGPSSAVHIDLRSSRGVSSNALASSVKRAEQLPIRGPVHKMEHRIAPDKLIVLREVGHDLTLFPSTAVLLRAVADALLCHSDAQFKAAILYREICPGNILIMEDAAGAYVEDLGFPDRPGLHGLLLGFAELFLPIYTPDRRQTEVTRTQGEMLKTAEGGGLKIRGMILKFLKEVECFKDWPLDDRAKKVELPLSRS